MASIRYGRLEIGAVQQGHFLHDLPAAMSPDCYFTDEDVVALLQRAGADRGCTHCRALTRSAVNRRQAKVLAQRLLDHWRQCYLVTYSTVLDKYRRLP